MKNIIQLKHENIFSCIYFIRGEKVILDKDLAVLYGVQTKVLKQAVRRNKNRFPADFLFELTNKEFTNLRSQFVTSSWGGIRYRPMAFTEHGVAMLSGILNSSRAIKVNIAIMRVFVKMRNMLALHKDLAQQLNDLENRYDSKLKVVFDALRELMHPATKPKRIIGFRVGEKKNRYGKK